MSNTSSEKKPTGIPPKEAQSKKETSKQATPNENMAKASVAGVAASPSKPPVSGAQSGDSGNAATTWSAFSNIDALWSINQDKNSWMGVAGIGWQKLSNASDSGIVALTMLASHAKQSGSGIYYRTEDDGMVHEIYAW